MYDDYVLNELSTSESALDDEAKMSTGFPFYFHQLVKMILAAMQYKKKWGGDVNKNENLVHWPILHFHMCIRV